MKKGMSVNREGKQGSRAKKGGKSGPGIAETKNYQDGFLDGGKPGRGKLGWGDTKGEGGAEVCQGERGRGPPRFCLGGSRDSMKLSWNGELQKGSLVDHPHDKK